MATRSTLRDYARIRADQNDSTFPTDTQYNTLLDFAGRAVWYDLIRAGWPATIRNTSFTAGAADTYNPVLTAQGYAAVVVGLYLLEGGNYTPLKRINEGDRAAAYSQSGSRPTHYTITMDNSDDGIIVELYPLRSTGTIRIDYILDFPGFSGDSAIWPGPARSDELVALKAAMMAMRKEGNDQGAAQLEREYREVLQAVQELSSWVDMRQPAMIRDVGDPLGLPRSAFDFDI